MLEPSYEWTRIMLQWPVSLVVSLVRLIKDGGVLQSGQAGIAHVVLLMKHI